MNKKKEFTVSYHKQFNNETGTVYRQTINVTSKTFENLRDAVYSEIVMGLPFKNQYVSTSGYEIFLKVPVRTQENFVFLNHTQTRFIQRFHPLSKMKILMDRNTCLRII